MSGDLARDSTHILANRERAPSDERDRPLHARAKGAYGCACRSGVRVIRDERHIRKTPRWWAVAPPTPAEAPQAKRRTAARSRGSIALVVSVVVAFVVSVLLLFFRVGRQVRGIEPVVASLVGSIPVAPGSPTLQAPSRPDGAAQASSEMVDAGASGPVGKPGVRSPPTRDVFRKPGF
jgi:hypothetical protein